jgi:hypothetical protein
VHNAINHLTSTIKSFAAATMGAPEIAQSATLVGGLPAFEIIKLGDTESSTLVIAAVDCERGVHRKNEEAWADLDKAGVNPIRVSTLIESIAQHLIFLKQVFAARGDMQCDIFDKAAAVPIVDLADGYATSAPWVETTIRYGGFVGFCQKERKITLDELMERRKARTRAGRKANRKAARAQYAESIRLDKEADAAIKAKLKAIKKMKAEMKAQAQAELARMQSEQAQAAPVREAARRKLSRIASYGYENEDYRKRLVDLRYVDPRPTSKSHLKWLASGAKLGFIRRSSMSIIFWAYVDLVCFCVCFPVLCFWYGLCCGCLWEGVYRAACGKNKKLTVQEKKLLKVMRWEQMQRDKEIKLYVVLAKETLGQLNLLFPRLQEALRNSLGYKLTLGTCVLAMKKDFTDLVTRQTAKKIASSQIDATKGFVKESVRPKFKMTTDYSLLMEGKSPIVEISMDFGVFGDEDGEGEEKGDDKTSPFELDTEALADAMPPRMKRLYDLFFNLSSPRNLINIFKTLAFGLLGVIKNGALLLFQTASFVAKCVDFSIIGYLLRDIGLILVQRPDFSLRALPFKLMRASKRILMLHTDIRRFYGSTKMLLKILSSMMGTPVKRLSPPQKLPVFAVEGDAEAGGNGHDDDDNELNADGEGHPELPGELADAAKEAGTAAVEAAKMPDEPPPIDPNSAIDGAIAAHDDDSDNDGDEDEKDEDDLEEPEDEEPDIHLAMPEQDAPEAAAPNEGAPKVATMEQV